MIEGLAGSQCVAIHTVDSHHSTLTYSSRVSWKQWLAGERINSWQRHLADNLSPTELSLIQVKGLLVETDAQIRQIRGSEEDSDLVNFEMSKFTLSHHISDSPGVRTPKNFEKLEGSIKPKVWLYTLHLSHTLHTNPSYTDSTTKDIAKYLDMVSWHRLTWPGLSPFILGARSPSLKLHMEYECWYKII